MAVTGTKLFFNHSSTERVEGSLSHRIRSIFDAENITDEEYLNRYKEFMEDQYPDKDPNFVIPKILADRKKLFFDLNISLEFFNKMLKIMKLDSYIEHEDS